MNNTYKRILVVLLLSAVFLTGCANTTTAENTIRIAIPYSSYIQDINSNYYKQWLEEKTGVPIEFVEVYQERSEDYLATLFVSKDADIDAVFFNQSSEFSLDKESLEAYSQKGYLLDVSHFITESTNYAGLLNESGLGEQLKSEDEGIYYFPNIESSRAAQNGQVLWLNYLWLKVLGLTIPTTPEELETVLLAFKQEDPNGNGRVDEIPLIGCEEAYSLQSYNFLLNAYIYNDPFHSRFYSDYGGIGYAPVTDYFRQGLIYCRKLYAEELMNERSFSYTKKQLVQLANSSANMIGGFTSASIAQVLYQNNPDIMASYIHVPPLKGMDGQQNALYKVIEPCCGAVILSDSPKAEAAFQVLDTMLSEEASLIAAYGKQEIDWDFSDGTDIGLYGTTATIYTHNYIQDVVQNKHFSRIGPFYLKEKYIDGVTWNGVNSDTRYIDMRASMSYENFYPSHIVELPDEPFANRIREKLDEYTNKMIIAFITGTADITDDSQWKEFQKNCAALGMNKLLNLCKEKVR